MAVDVTDQKYQALLLTLMVVNENFVPHYRTALKAEWFEYEDYRVIAECILSYYDRYKKIPTFDVLELWVAKVAPTGKNTTLEWKKKVRHLKKYQDAGLSYVYDHFVEFLTYRAYKDAVLKAGSLLTEGRYETIPQVIREAQSWEKELDNYIDFFEGTFEWLSDPELRHTITTGISELDGHLGGGTARGELSVILAPPNRGKTTMLINMGAAGMIAGSRVYHFHAEQPTPIIRGRYADRLLAHFHPGKVTMKNLKSKPKLHAYWLQEIRKRIEGNLFISHCAGKTIDSLRSFIYRHGQPDLLILDYADKLISARKYSERRFEIESIYDELIQLGEEFNCSNLTASQTNREALKRMLKKEGAKLGMEDVAEGFTKAMQSDNVIALCQDEAEFEMGVMRLYLAKVRNEESRGEIKCKVDFETMKISSFDDFQRNLRGDWGVEEDDEWDNF
jgi:replicative DNA helicase